MISKFDSKNKVTFLYKRYYSLNFFCSTFLRFNSLTSLHNVDPKLHQLTTRPWIHPVHKTTYQKPFTILKFATPRIQLTRFNKPITSVPSGPNRFTNHNFISRNSITNHFQNSSLSRPPSSLHKQT